MGERPRLTFLVDVDNTLVDNDAAKREMDRVLNEMLTEQGAAQFWRLYEDVRRDTGMVDIPKTLVRFEQTASLDRAQRFALADFLMGFPYDRYLFPDALATLAHLGEMGRVAILSDGDPAYQTSKIWRAGLDEAVGGYVLVYPHKEDHLQEVTAAFPADHYILIDDKPAVITNVTARLTAPLTTVFIRQGKYSHTVPPGPWSGATLTIDHIGELLAVDAGAFLHTKGGGRQRDESVSVLPQ
ncbi:MAG TPA: HAD family hydrolase [Thermomicrobiales bacterium]|nr:HAD family hydrolase [Thermomicrobiales bacterium]